MNEGRDKKALLDRITFIPGILGGKPVIRGRRLAVEHVLEMLAAGDDAETILSGYPWLEPEDIRACIVFGEKINHVQESVHAREWQQDVEQQDVERQDVGLLDSSVDDAIVHEEWIQDAEPDYDSEEEARAAERSDGYWVAGHA